MEESGKFRIDTIMQAKDFPLLNKKAIDSILELGDINFVQNLIKQYLIKSEEEIKKIGATVRRKKTSETYKYAEELRSSSLYIGTERIVVISTFIYDHAKRRNIPPLKEAVEMLEKAFEDSTVEIQKFVGPIFLNSKK